MDQACDGHAAVFRVRVVSGRLHVGPGDKLQPDRLPDACGAGVVASVGVKFIRLLPLGLQAAAHVVPHRYKQGVLPSRAKPVMSKEKEV